MTFKHCVTTEALLRVLECKEIDEMNFPGGFEPSPSVRWVHLAKVGACYECCLRREGNRTQWKHNKDAPRHLRKFYFGLADVCKDWCVKRRRFDLLRVSDYILISIYSGKGVFNKAEMKTHRCMRPAKDGFQAELK